MPEPQDPQVPPQPPDIQRRFSLYPVQWIGLPLLILLPVLALFGLFGETRETGHASTADLSVDLQYPTRYRYKMLNSMRLNVTNTTAAQIDTVTISVDTAYAARFSTVTSIPSFEDAYVIAVTDLKPGETRRVRIELQAEHYGRHRGEVRITTGGADTARVPVSTFIFP